MLAQTPRHSRFLLLPCLLGLACGSSTPSNGPGDGGDAGGLPDAGADAGADAGPPDAGLDAGLDAGSPDAGLDAGVDGGATGPITGLAASTWTWVDFPAAKCRDGSSTGIGVNVNPSSTKLMIYLQGGGACFNTLSCDANPSTFGAADFQNLVTKGDLSNGMLDRAMAVNPVSDWSYVWIPYCTGDVHVGNNPAGSVTGVGPQVFDGYTNVAQFLTRVVPTFTATTEVLLTGDSAGGFGAGANYDQVAKAFGDIPVELLDDSGPPMESPVLSTCLQDEWRSVWGLDSTFVAACGSDCSDGGNVLLDYYTHEVKSHPNRAFGLVESTSDETISLFFGFGENNCTTQDAFPPNVVPPETFDGGLMDLRAQLQAYPNAGLFAFASTDHTSIGGSSFYTRAVDGGTLLDWVAGVIDGGVTNLGP